MPTAAKAFGALFFGIFCYFAAGLVVPLLPEGTPARWVNEPVAAFGLLFGWTMAGKNAGAGNRAAIGFGLTAMALVVFWSVVAFAGAEMLEMAIDKRFRGPTQAVKSMFGIAWNMFRMIGTPEIILAGVIGGIGGGLFAEAISRRWS